MKKIYSIILTVVALLSFATAVNAQGDYSIAKQITDPKNNNAPVEYPPETTNPVHFDDVNKVAYAKNVSKPFKDGTYWIKLETFATGTASYTMSSEPADIVLVLDFSTSMTNNTYSSQSTYVPTATTRQANYQQAGNPYGAFDYNNTGDPNASAANRRYAYYNGDYHLVQRGRANSDGVLNNNGAYYFLYFTIDGTRYYLDRDHITTVMPTTATGQNAQYKAWWGGILYEYDTNGINRLQALKQAVADFVEVIYHNDNYEDDTYANPRNEPLGNRISIVRYSSVGRSRIVKDWTYVTNSSEDLDLSIAQAIAAETATSNGNPNDNQTHADRGMELANSLLNEIKTSDSERWSSASRTVVMFTDGAPGEAMNWTDPTSTDVANATIGYAKEAKTTYESTVFSVLVFNGTPSSAMTNYLNGVSSNYPLATSIDNLGLICTSADLPENLRKKEAAFYKNAGSDLSGVFQEIARQSGGDTNTSLSAATSTVDIVSNSFVLPDGVFETDADINDYVKVFTAKLNTITSAGEYVFDEEVLAPHSTDTYDVYVNGVKTEEGVDVDGTEANPTISVTLEGTNNIKVNGFDYANNWCGPVTDEDDEIIDYQGHKIIIMIPIKMNPEAVGGPNVATNDPGSGIIIPGQTDPIITFESPTVSLPVNIHIEKTGLNPGESAKFKIERAEIPLNGSYNIDNLTWKYVSSVFVTQPQGAAAGNKPVVKVKGLPSVDVVNNVQVGYLYKITEEDWSWSYERDTDPQYTVTSKVDNPFTFDNEKIEDIDIKIRHAESKVTNIFKKTGGTVKTDDSKPRQTK